MERKLIRQGRDACTITLPSRWVKSKGLEPGDSVRVVERDDSLRIETLKMGGITKIEVDVRGMETNLVWHVLSAKYVEGYDEISVLHDNPSLVQEIARQFIGMILERHSQDTSLIKSIIVVPEENLDPIIRRTGHLLVQQGVNLRLLAKGDIEMETLRASERLLDDTLLYCLRYLSKYVRIEQQYRDFVLCVTLESAGDLIKAIAKEIDGDIERASLVEHLIERYVTLLFAKDLNRLYTELRSIRKRIRKDSFVDGLMFSLAETLYNYVAYVVS